MRCGLVDAAQFAQAIGEEMQATPRRDARIELAQAAGGGVTCIRRFALALGALSFVQARQVALEHQHFAAHLEHRRRDRGEA